MQNLILFRFLAILVATCHTPTKITTDSPTSPTLEGAWKLVGVQELYPDGFINEIPTQESFFLFTDKHYSMGLSTHKNPSSIFNEPWNPTNVEKVDRFNFLIINAGTYQLSGSTMILNAQFALYPVLNNGNQTTTYELSSDTMRITFTEIIGGNGIPHPYYEGGAKYLLELERIID